MEKTSILDFFKQRLIEKIFGYFIYFLLLCPENLFTFYI